MRSAPAPVPSPLRRPRRRVALTAAVAVPLLLAGCGGPEAAPPGQGDDGGAPTAGQSPGGTGAPGGTAPGAETAPGAGTATGNATGSDPDTPVSDGGGRAPGGASGDGDPSGSDAAGGSAGDSGGAASLPGGGAASGSGGTAGTAPGSSPAGAAEIPMDDWKTFTGGGLSFRYPAVWSLEGGFTEHQGVFEIIDGRGRLVAQFQTNVVTDTDSDRDPGTYGRTDLDRGTVPGLAAHGRVDWVYTYRTVTDGADGGAAERSVVFAVADTDNLARRTGQPHLHTFPNPPGGVAWLVTTEHFVNTPGADPHRLTEAEAEAFMHTERYQAMVRIAESLRYTN